MRILIFGVTGMLGSTLFRYLSSDPTLDIRGIMRGDPTDGIIEFLPLKNNASLLSNVSGFDDTYLAQIIAAFQPQVILNCIGWRRQPQCASEAVSLITANSQWPHRLAKLAQDFGARLIHFSSDAVFSGRRGQYREKDVPDPIDAYGNSKLLGEPDYPHCLILRTSMIGHAYQKSDQLLEWLIRQKGSVNGYQRAIFSGLPTVEIALIIREILLPRTELTGVWHLAAAPISKFQLLSLIVERYGVDVKVTPTADPVIDRSLDASRFRSVTGYEPPSWPELVERMYRFQ